MNRTAAILNRWASLALCGLIASVVWLLLEGLVQATFAPVVDYLGSLQPAFFSSALLILVVACCWPLGHRRWLAFFGLRHFWSFPPLGLSAFVALLVIAIYTGLTSGWGLVRDELLAGSWLLGQIPAWMWTLSGVGAILTNLDFARGTPTNSEQKRGDTELEELLLWLQDDREVSIPSDDRFQHDDVARRIVKRLTESTTKRPTIAIVGPLGSGKSTIRRLVTHHLKADRSFVLLDVSLWPYHTSEAAVQGILRALIGSLRSHVNTLAITGLSERYVSTIESSAGRWGMFAQFIRAKSSPEEILKGISAIAAASGIKVVLWIEDMERFTGEDRLPPQQAAFRETERLGPILSLLHLLDRCEPISVIVSDASLRSRIDVGKIARFVEEPPRIEPETVWHQIQIIRSACMMDPCVDPADPKYRRILTPPDKKDLFDMWLWRVMDDKPNVQEATVLLLGTPRALKWALRLTWETWESLKGEIDFDGVLLASVLRVSRPKVFALIVEHTAFFQYGFQKPLSFSDDDNPKHSVSARLDAILDEEDGEELRNAVTALIKAVFPAALREDESSEDYVDNPQGLNVGRHTDYFKRYLVLPQIEELDSDQAALADIRAWKAKQPNDLVARLRDPCKAGQVGTFVGQFDTAQLCDLLTELSISSMDESAAEWESGTHAPGIVPLWNMMHVRRPPSEELKDTVVALTSRIAPLHLPLIYHLYSFFVRPQGSVPRLLDPADCEIVDNHLLSMIEDSYPLGSGQLLIQSMRSGSPLVVYHICVDLLNVNDTSAPLSNCWKIMARVLLEAAEHDPEHGIPLIVPFVSSGNLRFVHKSAEELRAGESAVEPVFQFDETMARRLFDFDRLIQVFSNEIESATLDEQMAANLQAVQRSIAPLYEALRLRDSADDAGGE